MNLRSSDFSLTLTSPVFRAEREALCAGRGSHAYLLTGPKGIGKRSFALACASTLLCRQENAPCLSCKACRKVMTGNHPDVREIAPEKNLFRVDQAREIVSSIYESSYEGGAKIYILTDFHKANEQAQNALLKTLEEPPRDVTFFLLTENPYALLPTVRSRCKTLRMSRFDEKAILQTLQTRFAESETLAFAARAAEGNIGYAIRLVEEEETRTLEQIAEEAASDGVGEPRIAALLEEEKERLDELLDCLEQKLAHKLQKTPDARTLARLKAVRNAREQRKKNVNSALLIEALADRLVKGKTTWQR